jgi:hypothetical protein
MSDIPTSEFGLAVMKNPYRSPLFVIRQAVGRLLYDTITPSRLRLFPNRDISETLQTQSSFILATFVKRGTTSDYTRTGVAAFW